MSPSCPRLALAVLAAGLAACGPLAYVNEVTRHADDAVDAARHAEADKLAPYWWTRATEYLHEARARAAHADFQGANRFGRLAAEAAEQAIVDAKDPSKRPIDLEKLEKQQKPKQEPEKANDDKGGGAPAKGAPVSKANTAVQPSVSRGDRGGAPVPWTGAS